MWLMFKTETEMESEVQISVNLNPNAFFSTWTAFVMVFLILTNWFETSLTITDWILTSAFSFALMVSSIIHYRETTEIEASDEGTVQSVPACTTWAEGCSETYLGKYLGMVSGIISLAMILSHRAPRVLHVIVALLLFLSWCFGVSFLTYGNGRASQAGSEYVEIWASFFLSLDIAMTNIVLLVRGKQEQGTGNGDTEDQGEHADESVSVEPSTLAHSEKEPAQPLGISSPQTVPPPPCIEKEDS
jgi:hypothetical protein